jgi:hypothetical protein
MVQSVLEENTVVAGHSSTSLTYADYLQFPDDGLRREIIGPRTDADDAAASGARAAGRQSVGTMN